MGRKIVRILVVLLFIFLLQNKGLEAEESYQIYQIMCQEPDGNGEYYRTAPEVVIKHMDEFCITRYQVSCGAGEILEGELVGKESEEVIDFSQFGDGGHQLDVWMENENGEVISGTEMTKYIGIDQHGPEEVVFIFEEEKTENCFSQEMTLEIKANDATSGVEGIFYRIENGTEEYAVSNHIFITIPLGFQGKIYACGIDKAGNVGQINETAELICENIEPEIQWNAPKGMEHWYNEKMVLGVSVLEKDIASGLKKVTCYANEKVIYEKEFEMGVMEEVFQIEMAEKTKVKVVAEDYAGNVAIKEQYVLFDLQKPQVEVIGIENYMITGEETEFTCQISDDYKVQSIKGTIILEKPSGEKQEESICDWIKDGDIYVCTSKLSEDGIYSISLEAEDQAGNKTEEIYQIIVDKTNPVILKVEEIQGKYMRYFEWDYDISDIIQEFTTYTYEIRLDHQICENGKQYWNEGSHVLEMNVRDAAGNEAKAQASFVVDNTAPMIVLEGIEEQGMYEEKASVSVSLYEDLDYIEKIFINGEMIKLENGQKTFAYVFDAMGENCIKVQAKDQAGNVAEEEVCFYVTERKTLIEKILKTQKDSKEIQEEPEKSQEIGILVLSVGIGSVIGVGIAVQKLRKIKGKQID